MRTKNNWSPYNVKTPVVVEHSGFEPQEKNHGMIFYQMRHGLIAVGTMIFIGGD